eukprot:TRINITY_DN7176_c0_g1_i1.p1 TRINITY_DN7176_c0_g1~~TRINITY_DN7176_c0_g1_i1.p1  ORF type:complete len:612 (-),score=203.35 TRINITY_DN7176_c0_g1_i1:211-1785(-)
MYRQFKTIEEINDLVAPPAEHKAKVLEWLTSAGVKHVQDNGDAFFVMTDAVTAAALFETRFHHWTHTGGNSRVLMVDSFSIPQEVAQYVDLVEGLSEFPVPGYRAKPSPESANVAVSVVPQTIETMYSINNVKNTGNSSVCVVEFENQNFSPSQLSGFAQQMNVNIPALSTSHIVGSNNPGQPGVEATLDIQYAAAIGQGADAWFWIEGQGVWLYGFANHLHNYKDAPLVHSISYGWDEEKQCQFGIGGQECQQLGDDSKQYVMRVNTEFQKIGIRGISLLAASGDSGANGRTDGFCQDTHLNPSYPAASPYITAVGATQISSASGVANLPSPPPACTTGQFQCASGGVEQSVSFEQAHFASGGGFSYIASTPSYQKAAVAGYLASGVELPPASYFNAQGRGFPDVSAFGSAVLIYTGQVQPVGGTSCSSPIFAGLISLINGDVIAKTQRPLGFLNPLLYKMAAAEPSAFTDVTVGDNKCTEDGCRSSCKGFNAAKGWDAVSGLGTPNFDVMAKYIEKVTSRSN